eukprot:CAMPEP_0169444024 /NCGR_PEP_ID=MMETSP1042-20121227/9678_1 /TAXON_ID=464988 /ORGANISM="Hemiselmis andersenii, Strain CCMP1180" /LENGTH=487 /DNA_ID=CAMNT_0009555311 /DNA_START=15 /DNA_END=1474 /DNA_ORIENTATION=+
MAAVRLGLAALAVTSVVLLAARGGAPVELEQRGRHSASLQADIAKLDRKLGLPAPSAGATKQLHAVRSVSGAKVTPSGRRAAIAKHAAAVKRGAAGASTGLSSRTAVATAMGLWGQPKLSEPWHAEDQEKYDRAVHHAQIVERHGVEVYHPLQGMSHSFEEDGEENNARFEDQLAHLVKLLEPSYLSEALQWAQSGDKDDNQMLRPVAEALEKPLIKQLDDEARIKVVRAVDALAKKHNLSLAEKEQLRAHLMAPLLIRIRQRVHSQVSHYVVKVARAVVLKAANATEAGAQAKAGIFNGAGGAVVVPSVPKLNDADLKFANALHDLHGVYKEGVVDRAGYEAQRAKLLSDWLKYTVNEAGGNSRYVLKLMFGGDVRGVTDTGIRHPSPISVHKKLALEKGVASMGAERERRLTRDLVYQLIHGEGQWGDLDGCDEKFSSKKCHHDWEKIRRLVDQYARSDDPDLEWGEQGEGDMSRGTKALVDHLG